MTARAWGALACLMAGAIAGVFYHGGSIALQSNN